MSKTTATTEQPTGRHCTDATTSYKEAWAKRYPSGQEAMERNRLKKGFVKHRAHVSPLTAQSAGIAA